MATLDRPRSSSTELAIPSPRGLDRTLAGGLAGFAVLVGLIGGVFWLLTGNLALVAGIVAFHLVVGFLYLIGAWSSTRWLSRICNVAARALDAGRIVEARRVLDHNLLRSAANTPMYAIAVWLRARVALREGELDDARDRFDMLLDWHWYASGGLLRAHAPRVRADLVLCLALADRLDEAERERQQDATNTDARNWLLADIVLLARRERFGEVLDRMGQRAPLIAKLPRGDRQCLALLHAWARFRISSDESRFRAPHADIEVPEPLRDFEIEQVEFMTRAWPELRHFLELGCTASRARG